MLRKDEETEEKGRRVHEKSSVPTGGKRQEVKHLKTKP